jgi:Arc/MetJ-type ribon-helix-helix transcriptional regulator
MKVSVSLPEDDVEFLEAYAQAQGFDSRSAVLHKAVRLLRTDGMSSDYEGAWQEWADSGDGELWDATVGDGAGSDAPR